jgi:hypothetical protein
LPPEIFAKIKETETEKLKNEFICRKENLCKEPGYATDPEYVAVTNVIEDELRSRGVW